MLTPEQVETVKQRLIEQIEATFPEDRKQFAKEQIEAMDAEQLEKFLIKNNLIRADSPGKGNCVFCSIISGDIKSYKIAENKKALAALEINPMARGHTIIIPKEHVSSEAEILEEAKKLAKKISSLLKSKLKAKAVKTEPKNLFGHEVLNVIPVYEGIIPPQGHATPEELSELQETLKKQAPKKTKEKRERKRPRIEKVIKKFEEKLWLPKRIP